ncbi:hypothetical protein GCM10025867_27280 [Frondihabitans sucicola]|uniref:MoeA C-terminal domain-containing protein n=1 Tax=Frondihabitans sucicola TaxID=1268041 RepID=A0ABN6XZL0_9MICO|nr:hypothetical protein [Frondihabitans sucicola]BDZ50487.1 hypothetical protein GCM10025867_27280 [Frondihabitans sucicola]
MTLSARGATPLPDTWLSKEGTAVLEVTLAARDSLIVPTLAVSPGAKGPAHVFVRRDADDFERVAVTEVAQLNGRSAITPTKSGAIATGDVVRVG